MHIQHGANELLRSRDDCHSSHDCRQTRKVVVAFVMVAAFSFNLRGSWKMWLKSDPEAREKLVQVLVSGGYSHIRHTTGNNGRDKRFEAGRSADNNSWCAKGVIVSAAHVDVLCGRRWDNQRWAARAARAEFARD